MAETAEIAAWIALFLGLYWLAAGAGELRSPNGWWMMLKEFERSPALRFVTGFITLAFGATLYLVTSNGRSKTLATLSFHVDA